MNKFFVSTPLDFEKRTLTELQAVWPFLLGKDARPHELPFPEVAMLEGGLEFETDFFVGLQLNFFLKTANRVLLRMSSFRAKDLPKFYQKFKSLPWLEFLPHSHVQWEVAAQKSRLNNEKRLQESAEKALNELFKGKAEVEPCATIYIRMDADLCTISLDSSGEHLHKRGWALLKGEAPLRETIAAFLLQEMIDGVPPAQLKQFSLLDPMMGSGTFLLEARALGAGQFARSFAFQKWKKTPKLFLSSSFALNYSLPSEQSFAAYIGHDLNEDMLAVAERNFKEVERQLQLTQRSQFAPAKLHLFAGDSLKMQNKVEGELWMIVNPPYGERLPVAMAGGLSGLVKELCGLYKPQKFGVLYPEKQPLTVAPAGYRVLKALRVNNGGLRCLFTILTRL